MGIKIKFIKCVPGKTIVHAETSDSPRDSNTIANDSDKKNSDLPRHADFERAFDKMKPHLLIACGFREPKDYQGNFLQASHFNDFFADSDDEHENFGGLELTSIEVTGKHAVDGIQLKGTYESPDGSLVPVSTPVISLTKGDGYNYPLIEILDTQFDKLLLEAELWLTKKKHGAGVQAELPLNQAQPNSKNKKLEAA